MGWRIFSQGSRCVDNIQLGRCNEQRLRTSLLSYAKSSTSEIVENNYPRIRYASPSLLYECRLERFKLQVERKMKLKTQSSSIQKWMILTLMQSGLGPIGVFSLHVVLSRVFNAYAALPGLDIPMHFLGGIVIAYFFHRASINASQLKLLGEFHPTTHVLLVFFATGTATVFWEFAEFINDRYFGGHSQAGLADTMKDMLMGLSGGTALLLAVIPALQNHATKTSFPTPSAKNS